MQRKSSIIISVLLAGLALQTPVFATDAGQYEAALEKTQAALADAATKAQLWSTTEILLDDAAQAAATGDYELAIKLVNEAGLQIELTLATAEREKTTWQRNVPR